MASSPVWVWEQRPTITSITRPSCVVPADSKSVLAAHPAPPWFVLSRLPATPLLTLSPLPRCSCDQIYNYGHTMMWWDWLAGTYKAPATIRAFNKSADTEILGGSNYQVTAVQGRKDE